MSTTKPATPTDEAIKFTESLLVEVYKLDPSLRSVASPLVEELLRLFKSHQTFAVGEKVKFTFNGDKCKSVAETFGPYDGHTGKVWSIHAAVNMYRVRFDNGEILACYFSELEKV